MRSEPMKALDVLVVEDDAMIGVLLGEMLEAMGYGVCALETTGRSADADDQKISHTARRSARQ